MSQPNDDLMMMDLESDEANMDDFFRLFQDDETDTMDTDEPSKRVKSCSEMDSSVQDIGNNIVGTKVGAPSDPRLKYGDVIVHAMNCVSEQDILKELQPIVEPDVVWISVWMNQVKYDHKKCREMHGLGCAAKYMSHIIASSPDLIIYIKEKALYKKPDDSSFLVMRATCTGSIFLVVMMNNALNAGRRLFSRNGFIGRVFRADQRNSSGTTVTGRNVQPKETEDDGEDEKTHKSTARSDSDANSINSSSSFFPISHPMRNFPVYSQSTGTRVSRNMSTVEDVNSVDIFEIAASVDSPMTTYLQHQQEVGRKRKKVPRQQSMMHRNFLNFRKQKILPEEVEVGIEGTHFELRKPTRPGSYIVSITIVCHLNPQHRVYKVESFRHLDWRQYFR